MKVRQVVFYGSQSEIFPFSPTEGTGNSVASAHIAKMSNSLSLQY